jgi:hypothetical protein
MKERIEDVTDSDDASAHHLNAKHQVNLFYELFISKRYADAALIGKALEISSKKMTRAAMSKLGEEAISGQNTIVSGMQEE